MSHTRNLQQMTRVYPLMPLVLCLACGEAHAPEDGSPDYSGVVFELRDSSSSAWVAEAMIDRFGGDTTRVVIAPTTRVYESTPADGMWRSMDWQNLTPGDSVDVWITGVELRSLAPIHFATQMVVW